MSKILVNELVNLAGNDKVTFAEGAKVSSGETLDLNGATITLSDGVGLNDQLLASSGAGLKWVTFTDTNSAYTFAAVNDAVNDIKLRLTGTGDAVGQVDTIALTGAGGISVTENAGTITFTGTTVNTTYDLVFGDEVNGANVQLTGSDSSTDTLILKGGSNIDITRSNNEITFSTSLSGTVGAPSTTTDNAIALFDGTNGTLLSDSALVVDASSNLTGVNSITTATQTASKIPFWYDQAGNFPSATTYEGALAFNDSDNQMYYAAGNSWYRIARYDDIQQDTNTTYSVGFNGTNVLTLTGSDTTTDTVTFNTNTYGDTLIYTFGDTLTFTSRKYTVSSETGTGNTVRLRLTGTHYHGNGTVNGVPTTDDIVFAGADGLTVERTDENTITLRQAAASGGSSYTDNNAKDAAAQALLNGTQLGIAFTYDSTNKVINAQVGTTPTTYNITTGAQTGDYLFTGSDRSNTFTAAVDPSITLYAGDTITFDNSSTYISHPMYIRVANGGSSVTNPAATGEGTATVSWTPTVAGTYYYQCSAHSNMVGTITVLSSGGGGGGSAILYDLYGTNTTSNNVFLNLDPSVGTTDQIEFAGGGLSLVQWDATNNRATINTPAPALSALSDTSFGAGMFALTDGDLLQWSSSLNKWVNDPYARNISSNTGGWFGVGDPGSGSPFIVELEGLGTGGVLAFNSGPSPVGISINGNTGTNGQVLTSTGSGLSWTTIAPGNYTLPMASPTVLGGIKIGTGLSIDAGGVVTVASGGSVGLQARQDFSGTTTLLADNATGDLNITAYKAYTLLKIETDADAWVRVYTDDAARQFDALRSEGQDPFPGDGVIAETRGSGVIRMSPAAFGYNNDSPSATDTVYLAVTNRSGAAATINVTLTAIRLEA
jgi:plastocyanin